MDVIIVSGMTMAFFVGMRRPSLHFEASALSGLDYIAVNAHAR